MTDGERFVDRLPRKTRFYDRHERRTYEMTRAVAIRLIDAPELVHNAFSYMERHMKDDPTQSRQYALWRNLLRRDVEQIVRSLLEDSSNGAFLRDTQPVFYVFPLDDRKRILSRATENEAEVSVGDVRP
jgi:hypothetical protein